MGMFFPFRLAAHRTFQVFVLESNRRYYTRDLRRLISPHFHVWRFTMALTMACAAVCLFLGLKDGFFLMLSSLCRLCESIFTSLLVNAVVLRIIVGQVWTELFVGA
jgi:hypothetical protein